MFYDIEHLKMTLNIKSISKFNYNNNKYSAFIGKNDSTLLINCFDTNTTIPYEAWLKTIFNGHYNEVEPTAPAFEIEEPKITIDPISYIEHIKEPLIDDEFIKSMGIETFSKEYKKHPNIKRFDYTSWSESQDVYSSVMGEHDVLFAQYDENLNIRYKKERWQNITGGKNTGAFIQGAKKNSTLLLCEGLKDGVNASIGFANVDVLVTDGKYQAYDFDKYEVVLSDYKTIIFLNDRDVKADEVIRLFSLMNSEEHEKVKMIDWSLFDSSFKDISEILKDFYSKDEYKSVLKRKSLPIVKKCLLATTFSEIHKEALNKVLSDKALHAIKTNSSLEYIIKQKHYQGFNLDNEAKHIISKPLHSKVEHTIKLKKYLSDFAPNIIKIIKDNHITLLNSPTNTGKSTLVKKELINSFKNIIYIAPLRTIVDEFSKDRIFTNVSQKGQSIEATLADLNASYIAMTTDVFYNLLKKFPQEMKQRLSDTALIVFDEQHLINESENFREKVTEVNKYLLNNHSGKVLFMSGTPHIDNDKTTIIKTIVAQEHKDNIYYYNNAFADEESFISSVIKEVSKHSVMVYCSSTQKVEEVNNLLRASDANCFSITSKAILWNGIKPKYDSLDPKLQKFDNFKWSETCVYICTTRATTGLNLPNLKGIYQYGTAYNSNTFIQLMARLRSGGFYHYITPFREHNKLEGVEQRAIGLCRKLKELKTTKLSLKWEDKAFRDYLVDNLSMERDKQNLSGFLSLYGTELKIIEAYGLGKFTIDNDDYIFNLEDKNISKILNGIDKTIERKFIDRILIDYLNKNNISLLNEIYNLSFIIHDSTISKSDVELRLITDDDKEAKKERRAEATAKTKEQKKIIIAKLGTHFSYTTLKKEFTAGEIERLIDTQLIDEERIAKTKKPIDKLVILREALIPIKAIVSLAVDALIDSEDIFTIKHLDTLVQQEYPTKKRNKYPYSVFLKALFTSVYDGKELQLDNMLIVKDKVQRNKKRFYDVLRFKKDFDLTQTKEFIEEEAKRIEIAHLKKLSDEDTIKYGFEVVHE